MRRKTHQDEVYRCSEQERDTARKRVRGNERLFLEGLEQLDLQAMEQDPESNLAPEAPSLALD